jgi:hypothetical protein
VLSYSDMPAGDNDGQVAQVGAARALTIVRSLSEARDGLLILAALLYGTGYLAWSLFAWAYSLGTSPALDAQYLLIGTPVVATLLALAAFVHTLLRRFLSRLVHWSGYRPLWVRVVVASLFAGWVCFRGLTYLVNRNELPRSLVMMSVIFLVSIYGSIIAMLFSPTKEAGRTGATVAITLAVTSLLGIAIAAYVWTIYPHIPQQLGGGKLRRAQLEVRTDSMSSALMKELRCEANESSGALVRRSGDVWLLVGAGDTLIVVDGPDLMRAHMRVEIPRANVAAIRWLE